MFNIAISIALLLSFYLSGASAVPLERRANGVITQCTTPNTVALTFVRRSRFKFATCSTLLPLLLALYLWGWPQIFYAIFRMTAHTSICMTTLHNIITTVHWSCILGRILLRLSMLLTQKELSSSVRKAFNVCTLPILLSECPFLSFRFRWEKLFVIPRTFLSRLGILNPTKKNLCRGLYIRWGYGTTSEVGLWQWIPSRISYMVSCTFIKAYSESR